MFVSCDDLVAVCDGWLMTWINTLVWGSVAKEPHFLSSITIPHPNRPEQRLGSVISR